MTTVFNLKTEYLLFILLVTTIFIVNSNVVALNRESNLPTDIEKTIFYHKIVETDNSKAVMQEFKKYLYDFNDFNNELEPNTILINNKIKRPGLLSEKKILNDVDYLFKLLKYGYAGYKYFGGDSRFNKARESIIAEVKERSILNFLTVKTFSKIIYKHLYFIQDLHFAVDGRSPGKRLQYYTSNLYNFHKDKKGYYTYLEGKKAYLVSINNGNYKEFIKLSLDKEGKVIYRLGKLYSIKTDEPILTIKFEVEPLTERQVVNKKIELKKYKNNYYKNKTPYNHYKKNGINIIEHRTASANQKNRPQLDKFAQDGQKFKNDDYLIIDLRGNSGGSNIYASQWIKNFSGKKPVELMIGSELSTLTANKLLENSIKQSYGMEIEELDKEYQVLFDETSTGWSEVEYTQPIKIDNDTLIFVLIGNSVASAGESFVEYLKQLENVIFLGSNTAGLVNFGNVGMCNLPNSRIELMISTSISISPDLKLKEGKGYYPDFWITPNDSLELTLQFINKYFK